MHGDLLEEYIVQQIEIAPELVINFFWHGGEPTILERAEAPDSMPCMTYDLSVKVRPWEFGSSPM
jgi:hypothetical protein